METQTKGLRHKIIAFISSKGSEVALNELYNSFPDEEKTTVRGRLYESIGKGVARVGKGLYISSKAFIELGDSREIIKDLNESGAKFDFIFLDIPYEAGGQKGGNRNLFSCDKISPPEFGDFMKDCKNLLRNENSPLMYMFTSGRSSKRMHDKYIKEVQNSGLIECKRMGTYQKLWANGNPMNMGKYLMPLENLYIFSKSGEVDNLDKWMLDFKLTPDFNYPTEKPYLMIKQIVAQATEAGQWVLDAFAGTGKVLKACLELDRFSYSIDSSERSFNDFLVPILNNSL